MPWSGLSLFPARSSQRPSQPGGRAVGDQPGLPEVARVEVGEVGVGVVDPGQEADLAALEEPPHAAADAAAERRVEAEAGAARERRALHLQLLVQVRVAAVVVKRHERVEQVHAAGQEHGHEHGRVRRGRGVRGGGLEHARDRQRLGGVEGEPGAEPAGQHLAARERGAAEAGRGARPRRCGGSRRRRCGGASVHVGVGAGEEELAEHPLAHVGALLLVLAPLAVLQLALGEQAAGHAQQLGVGAREVHGSPTARRARATARRGATASAGWTRPSRACAACPSR